MKKMSLLFASVLLIAATTVAVGQNPCNPCSKKAQNPCNPCAKKAQNPCNPCNPCAGKDVKVKGGNRTIVGYIGDSQCGLKHPMNMGDGKECTLKCVEAGGEFILADRENGVVYKLDKKSQETAREFAGQEVKVSGNVNAKTKTIKVSKIEASS